MLRLVRLSPLSRFVWRLAALWIVLVPLALRAAPALAQELSVGDRPCLVLRAPGDVLPVELDRRHLVYSPGEAFRAKVRLNLQKSRETTDKEVSAHLRWKLVPWGGGGSVGEGSARVTARVNATHPAFWPLELPLPRDEGVYDLRISVTGRGFEDVERTVQLVVVSATEPSRPAGGADELVDAFHTSRGHGRRVSAQDGWQHLEASVSRWWNRHRTAEQALESSPANWRAYRLHVTHPDRRHRLRLHLADGASTEIGACILEPDRSGELSPWGAPMRWNPSVAISQAGEANLSVAQGVSPEWIFWPRSKEPLVLVHSASASSLPQIEQIELFESGNDSSTASPTALGRAEFAGRSHRLCGLYLHRPWLAENFGAPQAHDADDGQVRDDWQTYLVAGTRLLEWTRAQGANAILLPVWSAEGVLYPTQQLDAALRSDPGDAAASAADPDRRDVLELLLRLCDRSGVVLIPELQFTTPLESLEQLVREGGAEAEGVHLEDGDGRPWPGAHSPPGGARVRYNPLHPQVQLALLAIVEELADAYHLHPALGGLACALGSDSHLQFPGVAWGYDESTTARFAQASQLPVPTGATPENRQRRYTYLTTTARSKWLAWRAEELGRFHRRLRETVVARIPQGRFLMTTLEGLQPAEPQPTPASPAQHLLACGLDFSSAHAERGLVVLRPLRSGGTANPMAWGAQRAFNQNPALDTAFRGVGGGCLMYAPAATAALTQSAALFRRERDRAALVSQPAPDPIEEAQRYAHALGTLDAAVIFDGGDMLSLAPPGDAAETRRAIAQLPAIPFYPISPQVQPVLIRQAKVGEVTWLTAVNPTRLTLDLELDLNCPATTLIVDLATGNQMTLREGGRQRCKIQRELPPFGLLCLRLEHPQASVVKTHVAVSQELLAALHDQVIYLRERMSGLAALNRAPSVPVANSGFEEIHQVDHQVPGWELPPDQSGQCQLDATNPHSGRVSLRLTADGESPTLVSPPLPLEGVRRATLAVWMRSNRKAARVELAVDDRSEGKGVWQRQVVEVGKNWRRFEVTIQPPPGGRSDQIHLVARTLEACRLWVDDLEIDRQPLGADEVRQLTKTISAIQLAWDQERYADCERLLGGYWGQLLLHVPPPPAPAATSPARERLGSRIKKRLLR
ncbi:MAG: family 10 glycosylhydrolase [Planctomycetales bacterium]